MNARIRAVLAPMHPAPLDYQASVLMQQALAANEADFDRRRSALFAECLERADTIRADHAALSAAEFIAKYGERS